MIAGCPLEWGARVNHPQPPLDPALSADAFTNQRESTLDTEGRNLAQFQMNSRLAKLQVSRKKSERQIIKTDTQ